MAKLAENLREQLPVDIFTDTEVGVLLEGTDDARYGLMKRAIASGDIIQLKRGVYSFGKRYRRSQLNLFELAQRIYAPSYISLESALSHHGWIPEAVYTITSVCTKRSKKFETPLGLFSYERIPPFSFLGVERVKQANSVYLIASPAKALIDYVYVHKLDGLSPREIAESLRIEQDYFRKIPKDFLLQLVERYRSNRVTRFINTLLRETCI